MKNANGDGSIYPVRKDGKLVGYRGAISYVDEAGVTQRFSVRGRTHAIVKDKLNGARTRLAQGAPVRDATRTVGDWMAQWRTSTLVVSDRKPATREQYANLSRKHLESDPFGATPLDRLRPTDVEALIVALRAKRKPGPKRLDGKPGDPVRALSDSTIRSIYGVLRTGLDCAVRDGLLARNPAALVGRPGVARVEAKHMDAADVTALLKAAQASRYHSALTLIAATGLRKGEALALSWDRVNLDTGHLRVSATLGRIDGTLVVSEPKTATARRVVPLSPVVVDMLRRHRTSQKEDRLRAGDQWTDTGLVFTTEFGTAVDPRSFLRVLQVAAKAAGLTGVGVHTLRHSVAVGWLENGVHIKAVADLLGHSSIAITGDVYGHVSDAAARSAVDGWSGALGL